jgi:hypothetical protein
MKRAAIMVVGVVFGCSQAKTNALPAEAWGTADYANAGLRIDNPWTPDDYTTATQVLQQESAGHRERLPHFHGAKSGAVFAKLLTDLPDDGSASVNQRFLAHATRFEATKDLAKLYMPYEYQPPTREWIELMGASLHEGAVLATISDAFLASFGSDDPKHEARLGGLAEMKRGYGGMLFGSLLVADQLHVSDDDRVAMIAHVTAALPALFPLVSADTQHQIRDTIAKEVAGFPAGKLHDAIVAAQQALPQ